MYDLSMCCCMSTCEIQYCSDVARRWVYYTTLHNYDWFDIKCKDHLPT